MNSAHWTPAGGLTHYTYDNNGNRLTTAYSSGLTVTATYDALNRASVGSHYLNCIMSHASSKWQVLPVDTFLLIGCLRTWVFALRFPPPQSESSGPLPCHPTGRATYFEEWWSVYVPRQYQPETLIFGFAGVHEGMCCLQFCISLIEIIPLNRARVFLSKIKHPDEGRAFAALRKCL